MNQKVAIIGAGPSGLCSAKAALENNLIPIVFDKAEQPCGLWIPDRIVWSSMRINSSKYLTSFIDFPWPDDSLMFPDARQVFDYLINYIKINSLEKCLKLNTTVESIKKTFDNNWEITYFDSVKNQRNIENFKFVIIATGINNKPLIPEIKGIKSFKGKIIHSSSYRSNDEFYKSKKVVVVGCSSSSVEIASDIAQTSSEKILNVFTRPYLVLKKLIKIKCIENSKEYYHLLPVDFLLFNRNLNHQLNSTSKEQKKYFKRKIQVFVSRPDR